MITRVKVFEQKRLQSSLVKTNFHTKKKYAFFFSKTIQNPKCTHKGERKKKCMMLSPFYKGVVHFKGVFLTEERGRRRRRERKGDGVSSL